MTKPKQPTCPDCAHYRQTWELHSPGGCSNPEFVSSGLQDCNTLIGPGKPCAYLSGFKPRQSDTPAFAEQDNSIRRTH